MRTRQHTVFLTTTLGFIASVSYIQASAQATNNSPSYPAARNQSVLPSSDRVPAAGPSSASPPSAVFVPQIALHGGEAEPVLKAQFQQIDAITESSMAISTDIVVPPSTYWGDILERYTKDDGESLNRFDYATLSATPEDMALLNAYIEHMAEQTPSTFSRDDAIVYWANLYNALTVQVVAQNYPVKSIRKIKSGYRAGPWKRELVSVEGSALSLDNIEHDILRPTYQTPLVHYMVNCASIGCPNLKSTPWQSATLATDQEAAARAYINSSRGAKISNGRLQVSSIYKWFKADFGGNTAGVLSHLNKYADIDLQVALEGRRKIDKYTYDWAVNAPK